MSDPMSDERLAEIRERAKYATDGPWKVDEPQRLKDASLRYVIAAEAEDVAAIDVAAEASAWRFHRKAAELDAAFIAHARQDVPALLAEVERLRAELAQVTTATTYLQGPEECLERECEEYFDDDGNERPGVEYCSHLKAKRLTVDEHLAAEAERDRLAGQVQGIEQAVHAFFTDADQRGVHLDGMTVTELCDAVMAEIRALDGTEAGR